MSSRGRGRRPQRSRDHGGQRSAAPVQRPSNPLIDTLFTGFAEELNARHDKYEEIVRLSRDLTIESKRLIFDLHRGAVDVDAKLNTLIVSRVHPIASALAAEPDHWKYHRAYSPGLQEFVEAATLAFYLRHKTLMGYDEVVQAVDDAVLQGSKVSEGAVQQGSDVTQDKDQQDSKVTEDASPQESKVDEDVVQRGSKGTDHAVQQGSKVTKVASQQGSKVIQEAIQEGSKVTGLSEAGTTKPLLPEEPKNPEPEITPNNDASVIAPENPPSEPKKPKLTFPIGDYILGVADLTGELMRLATYQLNQGDIDSPAEICRFVTALQTGFTLLENCTFALRLRDMPQKLRVMRQSLQKIEKTCYTIQLRSTEVPKEMLGPAIAKAMALGRDERDEGFLEDL